MRTRSLQQIAELVEAGGQPCQAVGDPGTPIGPDVLIDSRETTDGALFVALPGERVDGHDYVAAAAELGAHAAMVTHRVDAPIAQLICPDAQQGLTALARSLHARARADGLQTVAITGSAGKTSTKDLLAQILAAAGPTVSPEGSHNNELGTPLTVCQVDPTTRYLVSEMGARAIGDIAYLTSIVHPTASVVLNIGTAHIGEFGSQDNIAKAKGEIVEALDADGWAILNADDPRVDAMVSRTRAHIAKFSLAADAGPIDAELVVRARNLTADDLDRYSFTLDCSRPGARQAGESAKVRLRVLGEHQVSDAVASATAALALGLDLETVATALSEAGARSRWRMELHELANGAAVINDAYNANPESMAAALRTVAAIGVRRRQRNPGARTMAVLGDMLELGEVSGKLHFEVGELAARLGYTEIVAVGAFAEDLAQGARSAGGSSRVAEARDAADSLNLQSSDVVLVKASRGLRLEKVAEQLIGGEDIR
ncbi:UDP-N-acetylmuramoyl-tripeptide--D-alanyl-D-alanine ligase [Propionimicrobium sp. PCR01-08-3]|uniref:UDP-N-acetylmuramoyl-tripeptide--D-alanyl-D- alanine ligase n=1 Tax=Propionimicrobium sp. PCR01-08-3 TaxID=3052086 RepID=UPI00255C50C0|nr:UDP-N-acetylmuramoyl-tripeptide--D-alanyl-D-alanine ligase [Propionimicrobium sp. PCR01-08-3]WIY81649.1 UDP-N-acetylmuramoyl-tripeptide--D-alanyl-D-alanine ligase [Propionimicrobium sp. PCR01-08-3]